MGVEYVHYLIPRPNTFMPSAEQIHRLVTDLAVGQWILTPGSPAFPRRSLNGIPSVAHATGTLMSTRQNEKVAAPFPLTVQTLHSLAGKNVRLEWPVNGPALSGLRYPLTPVDRMSLDEIYYDLGLQWSPKFVYRMSECIEPFERTTCQCGTDLEVSDADTPFYTALLHAACPSCGRPVDVTHWPAVIRDGFTGEPHTVNGGATSRFALFIDCGKGFPSETPMRVVSDLRDLLDHVLGCECYEVGDFY